MKKIQLLSTCSLAVLLLATSCKKENSEVIDTVALQTAVANVQGVSVTAAATAGASAVAPGDSVYVINTCSRTSRKESIAFTALPSAVSAYLNENYAGFTAQKALSIKEATGSLQGYVAIIQYNGSAVGLKFDASGNFVSVLEQREGSDLVKDRRHHDGGRFDHRDGKQRDTLALSALPVIIKTYFTANYATDTLAAAFKNKDGNYVLISKNNGIFASVFSTSGAFISRAALPAHSGRMTVIAESALPANALSYLTATYPAYVFNKAFVVMQNTTTKGYVVLIEANSTRYAVQFDASGTFIKVKTIR